MIAGNNNPGSSKKRLERWFQRLKLKIFFIESKLKTHFKDIPEKKRLGIKTKTKLRYQEKNIPQNPKAKRRNKANILKRLQREFLRTTDALFLEEINKASFIRKIVPATLAMIMPIVFQIPMPIRKDKKGKNELRDKKSIVKRKATKEERRIAVVTAFCFF